MQYEYNPTIDPSDLSPLPNVTEIKKQTLVQIKDMISESSKVINLRDSLKQ